MLFKVYYIFNKCSVGTNIDFITKLAAQCWGGMLTFGKKIFIRPWRQWQVGGWTVGCLARHIFAYSVKCLGCTEVSRLPFPESLSMK